ncbi:MAG: RHS repeat-associated core domain-containing protein [Acetobacteraceae bacterium]
MIASHYTYRYTEQRFDPETAGSAAQPSGLYDYRARIYSPTWGRFLQPDPLGYAGGSNLYAYVGNDPLNRTDPSGQFFGWDNLAGAGIGAIGGGISGAIAGYHATGTWQGVALGGIGGAVVGGAIGAINPLAVGYAIEAAGGAGASAASFVVGAATFTAVNAVGGAAGSAAGTVLDYQFAGGSLSNLGKNVRNGAILGAASGVLEAPFVAAGGGTALGYSAAGDVALSAQGAIFGTIGTVATTCSVGAGCGPTLKPGTNVGAPSVTIGSGTFAPQMPSK